MRTSFAAVESQESFLQHKVENGEILVQHVPGTDNVADLQTKNLSATQTWYDIVQLGLKERLTRSAFLSGDALSVGCFFFAALKGWFSASADDPWTLLVGRCKLQTPHHIVMVEFCTSGEAWLTKLASHYGTHAIPVVAEVADLHSKSFGNTDLWRTLDLLAQDRRVWAGLGMLR